MNQLGISLYPDISRNSEQEKEYLKTASKYGFTRLFMCLLNIDEEYPEKDIQRFMNNCQYAKKLGFEIIVDISPKVMKQLKIKVDDLSLFAQIGASTIRLDENFDGIKEAQMTYNPEQLMIELNASGDLLILHKIMENHPKLSKLTTCHNYYPLRYSGLSEEYFINNTLKIKEMGLKVAAFVTSQNETAIGPWPINEGLCSLEIHRDLPIDVQIKHLLSLGINDILIGNAFASNNELEAAQKTLLNPHTLHIESYENSVIEDKIIDEIHQLRPDKSDCIIRSTLPRIKYQKYPIFPKESRRLKRGDVVIINDNIKRYKGELQILLKDIKNDGRMNLVGRIPQEEQFLLENANTWDELTFIRRESHA